jgi:ABC-2 family transporter protein
MFWRLLLLEKDKFAGRLFLWIEIGILALIVVIVDIFQYLLLNAPHMQKQLLLQQIVWPQALANGIQLGSLGNILLIIAIAVVTAQEYTWRTFHLWLSRGVSRMSLMAAKSSIILALTVLIVLTASIVGAIVTGILTLTLQGTLPFSHINIQTLFLSFLVTDLGLLPYAALTFMLTILFRNVVASIAFGLAFLFVIENVLSLALAGINQTTETIANYLPGQLNTSLSNAVLGMPPASHNSPTPLVACISLIAYTSVFAGIGIWVFRHQNFTD